MRDGHIVEQGKHEELLARTASMPNCIRASLHIDKTQKRAGAEAPAHFYVSIRRPSAFSQVNNQTQNKTHKGGENPARLMSKKENLLRKADRAVQMKGGFQIRGQRLGKIEQAAMQVKAVTLT